MTDLMFPRRSQADSNSGAPGSVQERYDIGSTGEEIERVERTLLERLESLGYDTGAAFAVRLAFQEAANNARMHGNRNDPRKRIRIAYTVNPQQVIIDIEDEGPGFDPVSVPDPTLDENLEIPAGRGLTLIRAFMTEAEVVPPGNRIRMSYSRS